MLIWFGVSVPAATPRNAVLKLNSGFQKALESPEIKERFALLGLEPQGGSPERFAKVLVEEVDRWSKVVKAANVRSE